MDNFLEEAEAILDNLEQLYDLFSRVSSLYLRKTWCSPKDCVTQEKLVEDGNLLYRIGEHGYEIMVTDGDGFSRVFHTGESFLVCAEQNEIRFIYKNGDWESLKAKRLFKPYVLRSLANLLYESSDFDRKDEFEKKALEKLKKRFGALIND